MPHIGDLVGFIETCFETVNIPTFFDFAAEVIKCYQSNLSVGQYNHFLECMVKRLIAETNDCLANNFKTNMAIQKIWDLIQDFTKLNCVQGNTEV